MSDTLAKADELEATKKFKEALEYLIELSKSDPKNIDVLWRLARAYYEVGEEEKDLSKRSALFIKASEAAKRCLELDDKSAMSHKWVAITISALGEFSSTKEKIGNSFLIKEHALKARELKPGDPTTLHLLGRWCYSVAGIGWVERKLASTLFAAPPTSSYEEALEFFFGS